MGYKFIASAVILTISWLLNWLLKTAGEGICLLEPLSSIYTSGAEEVLTSVPLGRAETPVKSDPVVCASKTFWLSAKITLAQLYTLSIKVEGLSIWRFSLFSTT